MARACGPFPATMSAAEILALQPDGVLLSNGPGDPSRLDYAVEHRARPAPTPATCRSSASAWATSLLALAAGGRTVKMRFGHRGVNQPVLEIATGRVIVTTQNHGYMVDPSSIPADYPSPTPTSTTARSKGSPMPRGLCGECNGTPKPTPGLQTPSASSNSCCWPQRTHLAPLHFASIAPGERYHAQRPTIRKVLIIGSGPIVIGQAAEFDYAGTQACIACREEGDRGGAGQLEPRHHPDRPRHRRPASTSSRSQCPAIAEIIRKERPDGLIATMGGQTALNLAVDLERDGVLQECDVSDARHVHLQHSHGGRPPHVRRPHGGPGPARAAQCVGHRPVGRGGLRRAQRLPVGGARRLLPGRHGLGPRHQHGRA